MRYFEDIAVGETERFGAYPVTREEVIEFAGKYDPQPFHLSDEAAAKTHFGRLAASGWHTCAMMMAMLVERMKDHAQASLGSPGMDELRWLKPVYPGDTLSLEAEVLDTRASASRPEMGIVKSRTTVYNQHGEAVMRVVSNVMIATRPGGA
jgi:acyl dehydratase